MKYMVEHFRGPKALYNIASHGQGIYFTTDTNEIILNGVSYSGEGSEAFKALKTQVETNTGSLEVLTGNGEGSVLKMVDNAINEFATKISDDNTVNTFKELVDYAASHTSEALQIVGEINAVKEKNEQQDARIEALEVLVGGSEEGGQTLVETVSQHAQAITVLQEDVDAVEESASANASNISSLQNLVGGTSVASQIDEALAWEDVE
jgi:hypothetical protein